MPAMTPKPKVPNWPLSYYAPPLPTTAQPYARPSIPLPPSQAPCRASGGLAEAEGCRRREGLSERVGASARAKHARSTRLAVVLGSA